MADAPDSKSGARDRACRFESCLPYPKPLAPPEGTHGGGGLEALAAGIAPGTHLRTPDVTERCHRGQCNSSVPRRDELGSLVPVCIP